MLSKDKAKKSSAKQFIHVKEISPQEFPVMDYLTEETEGFRTRLFSADNGYFMRVYMIPVQGWLGEEKMTLRYEILSGDAEGNLIPEQPALYNENAIRPNGILANTTNVFDLTHLHNRMECMLIRRPTEYAENDAVKNIAALPFRTLGVMTEIEKRKISSRSVSYGRVSSSFPTPAFG